MAFLSNISDNQRAGLYMIAASASFVTNDTFVKSVSGELPVGEIIAVRGILSVMLLGAVCLRRNLLYAGPLIVSRSVLARSALDLLSTLLFIAALAHMPIANLTSIVQAVPLAVIILAFVFLGERWVGGVARRSSSASSACCSSPGRRRKASPSGRDWR